MTRYIRIILATIIAAGAAGTAYAASRKDDEDNREYERQAEARREQERKAEQERLRKKQQQRLRHHTRMELDNLADKHSLNLCVDKQLIGWALNNQSECRKKLLTAYDKNTVMTLRVSATDKPLANCSSTLHSWRNTHEPLSAPADQPEPFSDAV